jgi:hypothetical protein
VAAAKADADAIYNQNMLNYQQQKKAEQEAKDAADRQATIDTFGQYSNDYQAQINILENDGDPSNDWEIPYLRTLRNEKMANMADAQAEADQQAFENNLALAKLDSGNSGSGGGGPKDETKEVTITQARDWLKDGVITDSSYQVFKANGWTDEQIEAANPDAWAAYMGGGGGSGGSTLRKAF